MIYDKAYLNSRILFFVPEIIIFSLYLWFHCCVSSINQGFLYVGILFGVASYVFFVIEHQTDLILDKINNIVIVREKMLFINKYIIKQQYSLSDISNAEVVSLTQIETKRNITYKLRIINKDNSEYFPFSGWSDNNRQKWQIMADKINKFNISQEPLLILSRKPFFFRLCFGILFGFFYFLAGLYIIFPKEIEPIIYYILNSFMTQSGYHQ